MTEVLFTNYPINLTTIEWQIFQLRNYPPYGWEIRQGNYQYPYG